MSYRFSPVTKNLKPAAAVPVVKVAKPAAAAVPVVKVANPAAAVPDDKLWSAYILIIFALFYIGVLSAFINRFGTDACKVYTDSKRNFIRGLSWTMIGISVFFIVFAVCEAKGFIITEWFTPKWVHMLSFIYYIVMFILSIFLYVMFYFNDSGKSDPLIICDDYTVQGTVIEGSVHSTISILLDILLISSSVMVFISLFYHMMKDTKGN